MSKLEINDAFVTDDFSSMMKLISSKTMHIDEVDSRRKSQVTALMRAATLGRVDVVSWLIKFSANVNASDSKKWTALHYACSYKHQQIIKELIEADADVNFKDENGNTPLSKIFYQKGDGNIAVARFLIKNGAKINEKNNYGIAITDYAKEEIEQAISNDFL